MSFREFTYPDVCDQLGLKLREADLYQATAPLALPPAFIVRLLDNAALASAGLHGKGTLRVHYRTDPPGIATPTRKEFELFSGVEFNVDSARGLNGVCDFLLTKSGLQTIVRSPLVAIAEAKNDTLRAGFGQGIASMFAAQLFNQQHGTPVAVIHGVVTTGSIWKFLRLKDDELTIDLPEYFLDISKRSRGILKTIIESS